MGTSARKVAVWTLRVILGVAFLYVGMTKLTGTGNTVEYFAAIGWGQWFRYATGLADVVGAVLLFVPGWTFTGAIVLFCSVGSGALISLTVLRGNPMWGGPVMVVVPLAITLLTAWLAYLMRPRRMT
jgi:uncharacterized membrane protein YphA (DoxX/SURF4 family)